MTPTISNIGSSTSSTLDTMMGMLRAERIRQGITISALSRASSVSVAAIWRLELGERKSPNFDTVWRIATSLGLRITLTKVEP